MRTDVGGRRRQGVVRALAVCGWVMVVVSPASSAMFSAQQIHRGIMVEQGSDTRGRLVYNGWFRRSDEPAFTYRQGGDAVAGVWMTGPEAFVVRSGTTESAPVIGRIVPSWDDQRLRLTIEPTGKAAVRTTFFSRSSDAGDVALDHSKMTRAALQGSYRATLKSTGDADAGWLSVEIEPDGGTRFSGDLPPDIPPALAAAAAAAIDGEVTRIYSSLDDVGPSHR